MTSLNVEHLRIWRLENGQYLATAHNIPGLVAQGRTESEVVLIARRWSGWSNPPWHVCTDPSHPPLVQFPEQKTLYQQVFGKVVTCQSAGMDDADAVRSISDEVMPLLSRPSSFVSDGFRLQGMRRQIAKEWGTIFWQLDNLAHLAGWFVIDCYKDKNEDSDELHFVLCLLALESIRSVLATINQLRAALADDTFGYWRTLYETFVKSRFVLRFTPQDPGLPGRFSYYANSMYLEFYNKFAPLDDQRNAENPWIEAETFFETRYPKVGKGSYGWAHPLIMKSNGIPNERPTFRHLAEAVDKNSIFLDRYYAFATSKTHGEFILGFAGIRPAHARVISIDSYSVGNIGSVLEFMTPLFKEILTNACGSCPKPEHIGILRIIEAFILKIDSAITAIKSSNPAIHGKDYGHGGRSSAG